MMLGRKGAAARPKARQVRVAEALQSDHVALSSTADVNAIESKHVHEASMVLHYPVLPLEQALDESLSRSSHSTCIAGSKELAEDKLLVGALDSACNRTCTGPRWLEGYLKQLSETAPKWVSDLVESIPERENFRFGNGSVVPSSKRWRLPGCIGGKMVLIWVSVVPIVSLGCLLGRDFLDAIGAVLNFAHRTLDCTFIDTGPFRLQQMAAGHFMVNLIPSEWPRPGDGRWKKCGLDGIVEIRFTPRRWLQYCMKETGKEEDSENPNHEHLLAESSLAFSVFGEKMDHDVQFVNCRARVMKPTSSLCLQRQLLVQGHGAAPGSHDFDPSAAAQPPRLRSGYRPISLESHDVAFGGTQQLAFSRTVALVAWTIGIALLAFSISLSFFSSSVEASGRSYGESGCIAYVPLQEGCGIESIHSWELEGTLLVSQSLGFEVGIFGRSCSGRNVGSQGHERSGSFVEGHGSPGSSTCGCSGPQCGRKGDDGPNIAWTSWRTPQTSPRFDQIGSSAECGLRRLQGQCISVADQNQTNCAVAHGQTGDELSDRCDPRIIVSSTSGRSDYITSTSSIDGRIHDVLVSSSIRSVKWSDNGGRAAVDEPARSSLPGHVESSVAAHDDTDRESVAASSTDGRSDSRSGGRRSDVNDEFRLREGAKLKKGVRQMITQAWDRHRRDQLAVSAGAREINDVFQTIWERDMKSFMNESFVTEIRFPDPFVTEIFTDTEPVASATRRRGLNAGQSLTLSSGWDFLLPERRLQAKQLVRKQRPYVLVLAFPCGPWSPLQNLNPAKDLEERRELAFQLVLFSIEMAMIQVAGGRHYLIENPLPSAAWKLEVMQEFIEQEDTLQTVVDMCRFNLRSPQGSLHRKSTRLVTSMQAVVSAMMGCRCTGDHEHAPVIGGAKITAAAGHYTREFSNALVDAFIAQYDFETQRMYEVQEITSLDGDDHVYEALAGEAAGNESDDSLRV